jgi:flagellar secretion chaperone FliS
MNPYFEQTILNADPIDLVRMMYQRTISWVLDARGHLEHKRIAKRSAAIMRAYAVLAELLSALRPEMAPELSMRLQGLYLYMQQRLLDANIQRSDQPLEEVLGLLTTLEDAWSGVAAELRPQSEVPAGMEESPVEVATTRRWSQAGHGSEYAARHIVSA